MSGQAVEFCSRGWRNEDWRSLESHTLRWMAEVAFSEMQTPAIDTRV